MNRHVKTALIDAAAAGTYSALTGIVYYEVMGRRAHTPPFFFFLADKQAQKKPDYKPYKETDGEKWFKEQSLIEFTRTNEENHALKAYFLPAENDSKKFVFLSHGYRSNARDEFGRFTKFYHDNGINVFMVDHQAAGQSEGGLITFGQREARDGLEWLDFMIDTFGDDIEIFLHGISMGCATVTAMTGSDTLPENVKFTVADCGYTSMIDEFKSNLDKAHVPAFPLLNAVAVIHRAATGMSIKEAAPIDMIKNAKVPVLFIHGATDDFVPTTMVFELYEACPGEKDLLIVDDAEHAESYKKDPASYEAKVKEFMDKYL